MLWPQGWPSTYHIPDTVLALPSVEETSSPTRHTHKPGETEAAAEAFLAHEQVVTASLQLREVLAVEAFEPLDLLAVLTPASLMVWSVSMGTPTLAGYASRSPEELISEGANHTLAWSPDGTRLIVATTSTSLNIYRVRARHEYGRQHGGHLVFRDADWHNEHTLSSTPLRLYTVARRLRIVIPPDTGSLVSLAVTSKALVVGTDEGYVQVISWKGKLLELLPVVPVTSSDSSPSPSSSSSSASSPPAIAHVACDAEQLGLLCVTLVDGTVVVYRTSFHSKSDTSWIHSPYVLRNNSGARCASLNPQHRLIAIGNQSGSVHVFHVSDDYSFRAVRRYALPHSSSGEVVAPGPVGCVRWSTGGGALAVGYAHTGLALWSLDGCLLLSTIPGSSSASAPGELASFQRPNSMATPPPAGSTPVSRSSSATELPDHLLPGGNPDALFPHGVAALCFGSHDFDLYVAPSSPFMLCAHDAPLRFWRFSFLRGLASMSANVGCNDKSRLALLGNDRVVVWRGHDGSGFMRGTFDSDEDWDHIPIPRAYLADNWPIRSCAVSDQGRQIALAGTRGLVCYNRNTCRWRRFGNVNHERQIVASAMSWIGEHVICVANTGRPQHVRFASGTARSPQGHKATQQEAQGGGAFGAIWNILSFGSSIVLGGANGEAAPQPSAGENESDDGEDDDDDDDVAPGYDINDAPAEHQLPPKMRQVLRQQQRIKRGKRRCELVFYPKNHLDNSSILAAHRLDGDLLAMTVLGDKLLVHLHDGRIQLLGIELVAPNAKTASSSATFSQVKSPTKRGGKHHAHSYTTSYRSPTLAPAKVRLELLAVVHSSLCQLPVQASLWQRAASPQPPCYLYTEPGPDGRLLSLTFPTDPAAQLEPTSPPDSDLTVTAWVSPGRFAEHAERPSVRRFQRILQPTLFQTACELGSMTAPITVYARSVSRFWISALSSAAQLPVASTNGAAVDSFCSTPHLFTYGRHGLRIWLPTASGEHRLAAGVHAFDREVYPLGVDPDVGVLVNVIAAPTAASTLLIRSRKRYNTSSSTPSAISRSGSSSSTPQPGTDPEADPLTSPRGVHLDRNGVVLERSAAFPGSPAPKTAELPDPLEMPGPAQGRATGQRYFGSLANAGKADADEAEADDVVSDQPLLLSTPLGLQRRHLRADSNASQQSLNSGLPAAPSSRPCFRLQTKLQPYLQDVVRFILLHFNDSDGPDADGEVAMQCARNAATSCRTHHFFSVTLELLLYRALEDDALIQKQPSDDHSIASLEYLPRVITFLSSFREFLDIVVKCARKIDAAAWPRLFSLAGNPVELLESCLAEKKFETASFYLLVVQRTKGLARARQLAVKILNDSVLQSPEENIALTRAITRFLQAHEREF